MDFFHSITPELVNEKSDNIQELLTNDVVTKIPVISSLKNYGDIKDMQLVRFRGLVQNMFDPEIYLEKYEVKTDNQPTEVRNGKFRDGLKLEVKVLNIFKLNETIIMQTFLCFFFSYSRTKKFHLSRKRMRTEKDVQCF